MKTTIHHGWRFAMLAFLCTIYGCKPVEPEENQFSKIKLLKSQPTSSYHPNYAFENLLLLHFSRFSQSTFKPSIQRSSIRSSQKRQAKILQIRSIQSFHSLTISPASFQALSPPHSKPNKPITSNPPTKKRASISLQKSNVITSEYPNMQFLSFEELNNPNDIIKQPGVSLNNEMITLLLILLLYTLISIQSHENN